MSSMRNAVQRRNHRERAQPVERQKWGLLEKSKDYKLRAADHKVKKRKLKALQNKASERNEDEFYFGMMSAKSQGGVKVAKRGQDNSGGGRVLSEEVVRLMKTQDVGYLRTVLQQTRRERQRMEEEVVAGDVGVNVTAAEHSNKKVFGEDVDELSSTTPAVPRNGKSEVDEWLPGAESASDDDIEDEHLSPEEQRKRHKQAVKRRKLQALKDRERALYTALQEVEEQRAKMNGTVGGVNNNGVKFKVRQRKK